jgi:NADH-quinone oxidoreductase subunit L
MDVLVSLVLLLPLGGTVMLFGVGKRLGEPLAGWLATATVAASFVLGAIAAADFLRVDAAFLWDPLSAVMTLVVTGVGALIHLYSVGYMHGDPGFGRFFAYMNLFVTSMLILVLADNFAVLFVGWELVGLSSYLLISFWFERPSAASAGKKAFVVNRVGDVGFIVALMLVFASFGTFTFEEVFERAPGVLGTGTATAITLLLLLGAAGKSAQLPLYVWLPDAMEGPTPVSALIHAATMVTAGVYMVARTGALFELAPVSAGTVATVGAVTALYAATIAIAQRDIKRVLAYSTISQLGYMFMAVGSAAYVAGIFHLMTHAFFKALLFLGAGSVIHALKGEQDMRRMGGLAKSMPITFGTMVVAWLAISGIPPLSGFWSKDEILAVVFNRGGAWVALWAIGLVTAILTAGYMARLMYLTFFGERRWAEGVHPHESPATMTTALVTLGVAAAVGGLVNTPWRLGLEHFLEPAFERVHLAHAPDGLTPWVLAIVTTALVVLAIVLVAQRYVWSAARPSEEGGGWELLGAGYYVDEAYGAVFVGMGGRAATWLAGDVDQRGIDGLANGVGWLTQALGRWLRPLQNGYVRTYGLALLVGAVALLGWFLTRAGVF